MIKKYYLLSPGPTPVPEEVLREASRPIIHHRTDEFSKAFIEVTEGLKYMFSTKQDVFILASTGTGAMEAAVNNILSCGDKVITVNGGKFGKRWSDICRAYGLRVREIVLEWGESFSTQRLAEELSAEPGVKAVFTTLSETSTGTVYDVKGYGEIVSRSEALLVVDGISGVGATPCPMDEWKIDVLIAASQKSFMTPPGLSYISFSPKAWKAVEKSDLPRFYFDARLYKKNLEKETPPFTPATSLLFQQKKALEIIRSIGLENLIEHHRLLAEATRAGVRTLGLELLSKSPGNILTAVKCPPGVDGFKLLDLMQKKFKVFVAGGQEDYRGKIIRIAHLGYMGGFDILTALSALEMSLSLMGYSFQRGSSIEAAEKILEEKWK